MKHQARCTCGWKGSWTVDPRFATAEGAVHTRAYHGPQLFDHQVLVAWGKGIDYVERG